ncbi:MAG: ankyrin repeat protein [Pseudohongiellaceae bacterium]|jgi:ankyrin repeat protein
MSSALQEILAFCRAAHTGDVMDAEELLEQHPELEREVAVAAMLGEDEPLAELLSQNPEAAQQELRPGITPLFLACLSQYGGVEEDWAERWCRCAQLLIDHGASVDLGPVDLNLLGGQSSPLVAAISAMGHGPLCELLLAAGASPSNPAALVTAAAQGRWDCAELLLRHGAHWNTRLNEDAETPLHRLLDVGGLTPEDLQRVLLAGADPNLTAGPQKETALHVATRRRRLDCLVPLMEAGADVNAITAGGMTPWRHAVRRTFSEMATELERLGAHTETTDADHLATALWEQELERAQQILAARPELGTSGPPEERRLLADLAAMNRADAVAALLDAGWELDARGLDGGSALHAACWFAAEESAQLLVQRGAPLSMRGDAHDTTPLGWVAHGSVYSTDAKAQAPVYGRLAELLLSAGSPLPGPGDLHDVEQLAQASEAVQAVLAKHGWSAKKAP